MSNQAKPTPATMPVTQRSEEVKQQVQRDAVPTQIFPAGRGSVRGRTSSFSPVDILMMQRMVGNRAVSRLLASTRSTPQRSATVQQETQAEVENLQTQLQGRVKPTVQVKGGVTVNDDQGLEREVDAMGEMATGVMQTIRRSARPVTPSQQRNTESNALGLTRASGSYSNISVRRTVSDAKKYISKKNLWRNGMGLIELIAALYLECSREFDNIYEELVKNLPEYPTIGTDGYDPTTLYDVKMALEEEISKQQGKSGKHPMPPKVDKRVLKWFKKVVKKGIRRRGGKTSDGIRKRGKMINAGGNSFLLYHAKTAPTKNRQNPDGQGKSVFFL